MTRNRPLPEAEEIRYAEDRILYIIDTIRRVVTLFNVNGMSLGQVTQLQRILTEHTTQVQLTFSKEDADAWKGTWGQCPRTEVSVEEAIWRG